jgi:acetylornithine deacetylase/succinyl-diaminopimelate desuccinylase-like protein
MKGQVAASAVALATLAREGVRPPGDVIFIAAADEEVGDGFGLSWLCEQHPDAVRADFSINEGAGDRLDIGGRGVWLCATSEKMTAPFTLRVHGRSGHASMPGIADNALLKAAPLIARLGAYQPEPRLEPEVKGLLRAVAADVPADPSELLDFATRIDPLLAELIRPLLALTFAPTMIDASHKRNVIPAVCDVQVDSRLLPGQTVEEQQDVARAVLGEGDYDLIPGESQGGTRSPIESTLWNSVAAFVAEEDPTGVVAPVCVPGFTDSHWLRDAFGTVSYGFCPARAMPVELAATLIHSANERVPVDDLELGVRFLRHVVRTYAG